MVTFDQKEAARLVADLREDDARMTPGPWAADPCEPPSGSTTIRATFCTSEHLRPYFDHCAACDFVADWVVEESAAGIVRLRNNAKPLADQLEAAAKEIERCGRHYADIADAILPSSSGPDELVAEVRRLRAEIEAIRPVVNAAKRWAPSVRTRAMHARMPSLELALYHASAALKSKP